MKQLLPIISDYELEQIQFTKYKKVFYVRLDANGNVIEALQVDLTDEGRRLARNAKSNGFVLDQSKK